MASGEWDVQLMALCMLTDNTAKDIEYLWTPKTQ